MSGIHSSGPGIKRKPVPYQKSSARSVDYRIAEQIPKEHRVRPEQDDQVSQALPEGQSMTGHRDQREQSQAAEPFVSEHATLHTSSTNSMNQERAHQTIDTRWTPLYLRRIMFIVFIIVFVAILTALAVLFSYSERNQGMSTANPTLHYLWTYGPTAIFTIVAAFWGQVEFRILQLMPWKAMAIGPQPARKSVLLDYISPWNILVLFQSLVMRHYVVSIAVVGSLSIRLMIVFSTGLFALQQVSVANSNTPLIATDRFDGSKYNSKFVDARPMYATFGVQILNTSYLPGTTSQYAVQSFKASNPSNSTLIGAVDAFSADFPCELGEMTVQNVSTLFCSVRTCPQFNVTVTTPSCHAAGILLVGPIYDPYGIAEQYVTRYSGSIQPATCANLSPGDDPNRMILSLERLRYYIDNPDFHVEESINLVCKPTYAIRRALVSAYSDTTSSGSAWNVSTPSGAEPKQLPQISGWDVAQGVLSSTESVAYSTELSIGLGTELFSSVSLRNTNQSYRLDTFFTILSGQMPENISDWFDVDTLSIKSRHLYVSIAAQVAKQFLTVPAHDPFIGTSFANENRLFMRVLSFGLIEALLVVLIVLATLLFFWAPRGVVTRDPSSIAGLATIFNQSPGFVRSMQNMGASGTEDISNRICGYRYSTDAGMARMGDDQPNFAIKAFFPGHFKEGAATLEQNQGFELRWWQPMSLTLPARLLTLAIPIALIVVLELLYQLSQRHEGLTDVHPNEYAHYGWTYIPASVMLCAGILFSMVDFNTKVGQPYHALSRGAAPAVSSILENHLGTIAFHGLWSAACKKQFAVLATTLAKLLAPILTIAVSGLYTAGSYGFTVTVQQVTYFNFSSTVSGGLEMTGASLPVTNLLVEGRLSFPPWTLNELVFPQIEIDSANIPNNSALSSLSTQVPAVRGTLSCIPLSGQDFVNATFSNSSGSNMLFFNISTPDGCGNSCGSADGTMTLCAAESISLPPAGGYFGQLFDDTVSGGKGRWNQTPICPSKLAVWGMSLATRLEGLDMAVCYENIEQVSTNVTFQLPTYAISPSLPPQTLENTAINITYLPEVIKIDVSDQLTVLNSSGELFDGFFSTLIHGNNPIPITYLANHSMLPEVTTAMGQLYSIVAAQSINVAFRFPFNSSTDTTAVNPADRANLTGTLLNPNPVRLRQNVVSTRILEGILATMFLCVATAFVLMDTRRVLPKNPCSIAAVASLLAGSEMLGRGVIPNGAEWFDDEELRRRGVFEGYTFSMGWWGDKDGEGRRFGIDMGRAEAEKGERS